MNRLNKIKAQPGFTLIELMIVVVILSVLALLAVTGYRKYIYSGRNAEAYNFLGAIRASQESYFQSFGVYAGSPDQWVAWPAQIPTQQKLDWEPVGVAGWRDLGVTAPNAVWFQYRFRSGRGAAVDAGQAAPNPPFLDANPPWFWAQALGDFNDDGKLSTFEVTSAKSEVFIINENE